MKNLHEPNVADQLGSPKQLIKPVKIEEMIQNEKAVEALCETRNGCGIVNSGIGNDDDILF